jgi:hypothetical protein
VEGGEVSASGDPDGAAGAQPPARSGPPLTDAQAPKPGLGRAAQHVFFGIGGGIASVVYGTVVVMSTLTAAYATERHPWTLAVIVSTTSFVLWIAHVYAHGLSESLTLGRRVNGSELGAIAKREIGIILAAVAPVLVLLLGAAHALHETVAVSLALAVGLVTLGAEGLRYARAERLGAVGTLVAVCMSLALGLAIVALKVLVLH